ncbi:alkyl hydroperoxide reductase [Amycolatopsis deserti]|uniref:Alkyl hydroperoxide reductase n=1 Tax=Amycolatopsis deserti TaxID=185696 RepID=A0ABQ3IFL7_9PSEU|nr:TlpA disulfide reductase family protein [Amycolatopsis deserti]GHE81330.1 alkyl hydroperoxide reductase [Amycolatopsis deserti]
MNWGRLRAAGALLAASLAIAVSGCSAETNAGTFHFVSPGGQTRIFYQPDERQRIANLTGPSVTEPESALSLDSYSGRVVVLNVWGSWCPPCRTETPALKRLSETYPDVAVLGVNVRDDRDAAADFMRAFDVNYPSLFDESGRILLNLRGIPLSAVPVTLVVDKRQRVASVFLGAVLDTDLHPALREVLAEH